MADFCGDGTCRARITVWFRLPDDRQVSDPCPACLAALAALLGAETDGPPTLASLAARAVA